MENKKKVIAASLGGAVLVGAGVYWYMHSNEKIDTPSTDDLIEPGYASNETTFEEETNGVESGVLEEAELAELTEKELQELFEGVYLDSVYALRNYLQISRATLMASEYDRIEAACPIEKTLPTDYKEQYKVWRENYRVRDMSYIFTDEEAKQYYVTESVYTYTNIYATEKMSSLPVGEVVWVTGIGYDKGEGWLRAETELGTVYLDASALNTEQFKLESKVMYATNNVSLYMEHSTSSTKLRSILKGKEVQVIGVGFGDATGWLKVKYSVGGVEYTGYVQSKDFSDSKGGTSTSTSNNNQNNGSNGSGGQQDNGGSKENNNGSEGSGEQQNNNSSGGDQGSNNSGGNSGGQSNTGDYWLDNYGYTAAELRELPAEQLIAMGFTQRSDGNWVDEDYFMLPPPPLSEEGKEAANESSEGVNWNG